MNLVGVTPGERPRHFPDVVRRWRRGGSSFTTRYLSLPYLLYSLSLSLSLAVRSDDKRYREGSC